MLEPEEYTGTVTLHDGSKKELTVTVGYDAEEGGYYLADPVRKIAVADYAARVYKQQYDMKWSEDNSGWDDKILLTYSTYCQVYDYFKAKGTDSIDGFGVPLLILSDYCYSDGTPMDNAGFLGIQDGWGLFAASGCNDFGEAVDVIAHEYTHGIREYSLGGDLYENRTGAIHEAYSDILGNICEMELGMTEDEEWLLGETCGRILRNMSDPREYGQPSFEGDVYYCEETAYPNEDNDQGGVHINSGILGNIAWQIAGLGLDENEQYWLWAKSNELLTPLSDYDDVCAALLFISRISGYPEPVSDGIYEAFSNALVLDPENETLWRDTGDCCFKVEVDPQFLQRIAGLSVEAADTKAIVGRGRADCRGQFLVSCESGTYCVALLVYANGGKDIEKFYYDELGRWVIDESLADRITVGQGEEIVLNSPH